MDLIGAGIYGAGVRDKSLSPVRESQLRIFSQDRTPLLADRWL
jgi:hypothetical protein